MSLATFLEESHRRDVSLGVVNNETPASVRDLLERLFDRQSVTVTESVSVPDAESASEDMVYLLEDGEIQAASPLETVANSILLVNSDLYMTGARSPDEVELPDVIGELDETQFRLRGYPESNKEKLLLITVSRYIERTALECRSGTHRASFQYLSRLTDEHGTRAVYERLADTDVDVHLYGMPDWLADTDVDVHLYGMPDWTPPSDFDITMHGGWGSDFRDSWFVVYVPEDRSHSHVALLAIQDEPGTWNGFWTYDPDTVREINRYIEREL